MAEILSQDEIDILLSATGEYTPPVEIKSLGQLAEYLDEEIANYRRQWDEANRERQAATRSIELLQPLRDAVANIQRKKRGKK
jgi:flagellar motor switch protein FliM